ncbi:hypothetical protein LOTGIDRAFT_233395 [Lottia gigantea]|uniref:Calponin-homology (CH) domain-containing protein n=1 Tax=Lottia gigantea TaxID=225164 RepID=V3ZJY8_LOTGI|nr:hypothetical protein LOTGIDRAFT_233395 [Lottia gigantea]ESO91608.1 hypothetical protein LOTGIDRAFT_233395 [Lottia gigantea]
MSMRTRIRGFTAWVNLRINPYNHLLNNVLMDILTGTNMKYFLESFTGRDLKRLETFDGLTAQQKITRVDWIVDELKACKVIPEDVHVDSRLFAMRSTDHVFDLIWRLISHDIWFVWERVEFLQHDDIDILTQVPFKWTPDPPPQKKKKSKSKQSLLTGFGSSSMVEDTSVEPEPDEEWVQFPRADFMKNFKKKRRDFGKYPTPENCILEMVNTQLKKTKEGRSIHCYTVDDLVDSRVLCALVNSFVPSTFTADLLLNDRWTINLILRTAERMFYINTPFDSEDLVDADPMAVCSYFCFFFMCAYKYRQLKAVINRIDWIKKLMRECYQVINRLPETPTGASQIQQKKDMLKETGRHKDAIVIMEKRYDVTYGRKWLQDVENCKLEARKEIKKKIKDRFDIITIPRNITINDLCLSFVINLSLTNGSGFYLLETKEMLTDGRKVVLFNKQTEEFLDDFTVKTKVPIKKILKLPDVNVVELNPQNYPQYDIYVEASSRNKQMKNGTKFLYQVFPGNTVTWQRHFIKCARENDYDVVDKMITFFMGSGSFVNCKEPKSGMSALHWASREGNTDIVLLLLENGANIDAKNNFKCTPFHSAVEGLQRKICHILIEWGCDVHIKNNRGQTPIESAKNDDFKQYLVELYTHYSEMVPRIMNGDMELLKKVIKEQEVSGDQFHSIQSRCINGSTLLHTACYYGDKDVVLELLSKHRFPVSLLDYKSATPLHRAKDVSTMEILLECEAVIDSEDCEGNTPLHVKCYGESGKPSELPCIELLLNKKADQTKRNHKGLLPIHCCAMQGRTDVMQLLMTFDTEQKLIRTLNEEEDRHPPSLLHLALANDFIDASYWLMENGFSFKEKEPDILLKRILTEQIKLNDRAVAAKFLMENGADPNPHYPGGNTALHYASSLSGTTDILELILTFGGDVDLMNDEGCTPLFFATQSNNQLAACILIGQGASVRHKNMQGLTAFDYIVDFEEWIESGYFTDDVKARLKAYSLKHARDLIRAITKRVKPTSNQPGRSEMGKSTISLKSQTSSPVAWSRSQVSHNSITQYQPAILPPIGQTSGGYLMF